MNDIKVSHSLQLYLPLLLFSLSHYLVEQKFRLLRCGVKSVYYLVEGTFSRYQSEQYRTLSAEAVAKALKSTVAEGFLVRETAHSHETVSFFVSITKYLKKKILPLESSSSPRLVQISSPLNFV